MIAVVGGGITGLALGWELDRLDTDFVVLEASGRAGGVIRSREVDGRVLDWGPQRIRLTREVRRLVGALGLEGEVVEVPRDLQLFVYRDGRLRAVPFSAAALLGSDVVSARAKLRLLLEPLTAAPRPDERVADCFRRKVGREVYETLVAPLYGGLYASDPADMVVRLSLAHVLREFGVERSLLLPLLRRGGRVDPPAACSFGGGMGRLPAALADRLGGRLRLDAPVEAIAPSPGGGGWRLELAGEAIEAESVVLTVPAPAAARLLSRVAPGAAAAAGRLRYNPLAVVHLEADTGLRGLGFQVAFTEDLALRGVTFNHALFGSVGDREGGHEGGRGASRDRLHTAYLGGARRPDVVKLDDASLGRLAVEEFRRCTGANAAPLAVERERMPAWDGSWAALDGWSLPGGLHVAASWRSRPGIPGRLADAQRVAETLAAPARTAGA